MWFVMGISVAGVLPSTAVYAGFRPYEGDQLAEHARIILDGVIEALVTVLVHKVIDLHVRSVAVCLICQAVVIQLLGIYSHVGYVGIG